MHLPNRRFRANPIGRIEGTVSLGDTTGAVPDETLATNPLNGITETDAD